MELHLMKKAKVSKGIVRMVWPWVKTLPDGTTIEKPLPPQYQGLNGKPIPDCIVDVPDEVQPRWIWNGKAYVRPVKKPIPKSRSDLIEVVAEKLGVTYDDLMAEIMARKKLRRDAAKAD